MASAVIPPPAAYAPTLALAAIPLAIWSTISSLELIAVRRDFRPGRPLGPDLAALTRDRVRRALLGSRFAAPPWPAVMAGLRLAAGLALPIAAATGAEAAAGALFATIAACTAWLSIVMGGADGADKIALVACLSGSLIAAGMLADDRLLCLAGVAWGAGQAAIAYAASGWAKLARGFWRDGAALAAAMTSHRSGSGLAARIVERRGVAVALAWAIMLAEALFPLALVAPPAVCLAALAALALFHLATAIVMGLNTYPWAFAATYPCVVAANALMAGR